MPAWSPRVRRGVGPRGLRERDERLLADVDVVDEPVLLRLDRAHEAVALGVVTDRLGILPGVLGDEESSYRDSFGDGLLDHPHFTRPADFRGMKVPEVLLGGNHAEIEKWRRREALRSTLMKRPELLATAELDGEDRKIVADLKNEVKM